MTTVFDDDIYSEDELEDESLPSLTYIAQVRQKLMRTVECEYNAPFFAVIKSDRALLKRACCNHWDCARCGISRALHEYWRIVQGCENLGVDNALYLVTITCKGRDGLSVSESEGKYLEWTKKLNDAWRLHTKRGEQQEWTYVQVTERQKRGHPHSHYLCTMCPEISRSFTDEKGRLHHRSDWFTGQVQKAGLGIENDIQPLVSPAAASRYIAKYLFKSALSMVWAKGWKRVRYSHSFPKATEREIDSETIVLLRREDWTSLMLTGLNVECWNDETLDKANSMLPKQIIVDKSMQTNKLN